MAMATGETEGGLRHELMRGSKEKKRGREGGNEKRRRANRQEKESVEGQIANSRITDVSILVFTFTTFTLLILIPSEILDSTFSTLFYSPLLSLLSTMSKDSMPKVLYSTYMSVCQCGVTTVQ